MLADLAYFVAVAAGDALWYLLALVVLFTMVLTLRDGVA